MDCDQPHHDRCLDPAKPGQMAEKEKEKEKEEEEEEEGPLRGKKEISSRIRSNFSRSIFFCCLTKPPFSPLF